MSLRGQKTQILPSVNLGKGEPFNSISIRTKYSLHPPHSHSHKPQKLNEKEEGNGAWGLEGAEEVQEKLDFDGE